MTGKAEDAVPLFLQVVVPLIRRRRKTMCPNVQDPLPCLRTRLPPRRRRGERSASCCAQQTKSQEDERSEGVTEREWEGKQEWERGGQTESEYVAVRIRY